MREELFAHEVAAFTPPDRAYLLAGFKSRPEFARANACRLLRKAAVVRRIDELRAEFRERCALNVEYLQALLLPIVECNVLDCFEQAGQSAAPTASRKRKTEPASEAASSRCGSSRSIGFDVSKAWRSPASNSVRTAPSSTSNSTARTKPPRP
jgi:hypothetical protein